MSRSLVALVLVGLLGACSIAPEIYYSEGKKIHRLELARVLRDSPRQWKRGIHKIDLGRSRGTSSHIVWVRDREEPHSHALHDVTILLLKGCGTLTVGSQRVPMKPDTVVTVPRGVVHSFVSELKKPAAAYVVFSPPFDEGDVLRVLPPMILH